MFTEKLSQDRKIRIMKYILNGTTIDDNYNVKMFNKKKDGNSQYNLFFYTGKDKSFLKNHSGLLAYTDFEVKTFCGANLENGKYIRRDLIKAMCDELCEMEEGLKEKYLNCFKAHLMTEIEDEEALKKEMRFANKLLKEDTLKQDYTSLL